MKLAFRLVLVWVIVPGFSFLWRTFISVCNQPPRPTQHSIPPWSVNEDQLRLGRQRQEWFIRQRLNVGCTGEIPWELVVYLSALEVCSRWGAIQIYIYLTLPYLTFWKKQSNARLSSVGSRFHAAMENALSSIMRVALFVRLNPVHTRYGSVRCHTAPYGDLRRRTTLL